MHDDLVRLHHVRFRRFAGLREAEQRRRGGRRFRRHGGWPDAAVARGWRSGRLPAPAAPSALATHCDGGDEIGAQAGLSVSRFRGARGAVVEPDLEPLRLGFELAADHGHFFGLLHGDHVVELRTVLSTAGGRRHVGTGRASRGVLPFEKQRNVIGGNPRALFRLLDHGLFQVDQVEARLRIEMLPHLLFPIGRHVDFVASFRRRAACPLRHGTRPG